MAAEISAGYTRDLEIKFTQKLNTCYRKYLKPMRGKDQVNEIGGTW